MAEAARCELDLKVLQIPQLQWDIDTPDDLDALHAKADPGCSS
jgi:2-phospho-L-lactate guanylyltransferase (CobY/MobA/RfbA family)